MTAALITALTIACAFLATLVVLLTAQVNALQKTVDASVDTHRATLDYVKAVHTEVASQHRRVGAVERWAHAAHPVIGDHTDQLNGLARTLDELILDRQ